MTWQPIETAPKDETTVIIGGNGWVDVGFFTYVRNWKGQHGWYLLEESWRKYEVSTIEPTHWMPLPEPPEA